MIKRYVCENSLVYPERFEINKPKENEMKHVKGFYQQGYEVSLLQSGNMYHVILKKDEKLLDRTTLIDLVSASDYFDTILNYLTTEVIK